MKKTTPEDDLTPAERRRLAIAEAVATLVKGLLHDQIAKIEQDAAEAAEDTSGDQDASPVIAKVAVAIDWPAGAEFPELNCKLSYSVRRKFEESMIVDPTQMKLELVQPEKPAA